MDKRYTYKETDRIKERQIIKKSMFYTFFCLKKVFRGENYYRQTDVRIEKWIKDTHTKRQTE